MKTLAKLFYISFLLICIINNLHSINIIKNSFYEIYKAYYENHFIQFIYYFAIILDIILIVMIFFETKLNSKTSKLIVSATGYLFVLNILLEIFYSKTFYYGEIRDKQGFPIDMNNWGIIGSILISVFIMCFINKEQYLKKSWNVVLLLSLLLLNSLIFIAV